MTGLFELFAISGAFCRCLPTGPHGTITDHGRVS
jgi:hypothetical protein